MSQATPTGPQALPAPSGEALPAREELSFTAEGVVAKKEAE
jgi:hypothetical protein